LTCGPSGVTSAGAGGAGKPWRLQATSRPTPASASPSRSNALRLSGLLELVTGCTAFRNGNERERARLCSARAASLACGPCVNAATSAPVASAAAIPSEIGSSIWASSLSRTGRKPECRQPGKPSPLTSAGVPGPEAARGRRAQPPADPGGRAWVDHRAGRTRTGCGSRPSWARSGGRRGARARCRRRSRCRPAPWCP
jgi:hypothetical protein